MIKAFYLEDIISHLAALITYGLKGGYSPQAIEEHIVSSPFIAALESNEFDVEAKLEKTVIDAYGVKLKKEADISIKALFLAQSYIHLFFHYNKSFEYLFLYWPLSLFLEHYGIYHEMDSSSLRKDFELEIKKKTLLKKLSQERQIKLIEISKLTGINENTIDKYARNDAYLYGASSSNIYKLSILFGVKENLFVPNLSVYLDPTVYLEDESNKDLRNYLGLFFASYFDNRIAKKDFSYEKEKNYFKSKDGMKFIVIAEALSNLSLKKLSDFVDERTYLVIIPSLYFGEEEELQFLTSLNSFETLILTSEHAYFLKKQRKKEITDTISRFLLIRAKEESAKRYHNF